MTKTIQENLNLATSLIEKGFKYAVRDQNGSLVATTSKPIKFESAGEWGSRQTLDLAEKATVLPESYFDTVTFQNEEPSELTTLNQAYLIARAALANEQEESVPTKPTIPQILHSLGQMYDSGMGYITRNKAGDLELFKDYPTKDLQTNKWTSSNPYDFRTVLPSSADPENVFADIQANDDAPESIDDVLEKHGLLDTE